MELNKIYCSDYKDFLKGVDDESIDLSIVDPPYNLSIDYWDVFESEKEFLDFTYDWIDRLIPKLKKTGSLYVFNTPYNSSFILKYLVDKNMKFQNWIVWDKRDGMSSHKRRYNSGQETLLFFTKTDKYIFNYNDIRVPYESTERIEQAKSKGILKNGKRWFPNENGKLCGDIWHITSQRHKDKVKGRILKGIHCTPKPIEMYERIIKASSNTNDIILDPFSGVGTTAIVCKNLGRNYICNDKDERYVKIALEKLGI